MDLYAQALKTDVAPFEKNILRDLASQVAQIASSPVQNERKRLWTMHNSLKPERIMIMCYPEKAWNELLPKSLLMTQNPIIRTYEWYMRYIIYRWENILDDYVVEPEINIPLIYRNTGWGLDIKTVSTQQTYQGQDPSGLATPVQLLNEHYAAFTGYPSSGAFSYDPPLKNPDDIIKLCRPKIIADEETTRAVYEMMNDLIGDIINVRINRNIAMNLNLSLIGTLNSLRGIEQVMIDMYDRPQWLHQVMSFLTDSTLQMMDDIEKDGYIEVNNKNHYVGTGGLSYTDELPQKDFDGMNVRYKDCWGFATMQSGSYISPEMQFEFIIQYQMKLLEAYGLKSFGCCEPLTAPRFDIIKKIDRLRRVSVSPFTDICVAAKKLEDKFIFSWKPNPSYISSDFYDPDFIRKYLKNTIEAARGCVVEIIQKDLITVNNDPSKLNSWTQIARELVEDR